MPLHADLLRVRDRSDRAARLRCAASWLAMRRVCALPSVAPRRLRPGSLSIRPMMDTQRLIALVVFSFSALLLWDAWQKHNAPEGRRPRRPRRRRAAGAPAPTAPHARGAGRAAPRDRARRCRSAAAAAATGGEPVTVKTDLFDVELNTARRRHPPRDDAAGAFRARPHEAAHADGAATPSTTSSRRSGLLGEGLPTHKTVYEAEQRELRACRRARTASRSRLKARDASGAEVVKRYRFHRGSYVIDVALRDRQQAATSRSRRTPTSSSCATAIRPARRRRRPAPSRA